MTARKPRMPSGLGEAGRALWKRLAAEYEFDVRELVVVEHAARQADALALLERLLAEQGPVVRGSAGQPRLSQVVAELRQGRLALGRLLDLLALPELQDEAESARRADVRARGVTGASRRAKRAADARWSRVRLVEEERHGTGS